MSESKNCVSGEFPDDVAHGAPIHEGDTVLIHSEYVGTVTAIEGDAVHIDRHDETAGEFIMPIEVVGSVAVENATTHPFILSDDVDAPTNNTVGDDTREVRRIEVDRNVSVNDEHPPMADISSGGEDWLAINGVCIDVGRIFFDTAKERYVAVHAVESPSRVRLAALTEDDEGDYDTHIGTFTRQPDDDDWIDWHEEGGRFIPT